MVIGTAVVVWLVVAGFAAGTVWDSDEQPPSEKIIYGLAWPLLPFISCGRWVARRFR